MAKWGARTWGKQPQGTVLGVVLQRADGSLWVRLNRRVYVCLWAIGYRDQPVARREAA